MTSAFERDAAPSLAEGKDFGRLGGVAAEAMLEQHRLPPAGLGDREAHASTLVLGRAQFRPPMGSSWERRNFATLSASLAARPWVTSAPRKPTLRSAARK